MTWFWIAAAFLQAVSPASLTQPVPLVENGFCAWPLWISLRNGETATRTTGIDTSRYDIISRDGGRVTLISSGNGVGQSVFRNGDFTDLRSEGSDRWQVRRRSGQAEFRYVFVRRDPRVARFSEPILSMLSVSGQGLDELWLDRFSSRTDAERRCGTD